MQIFEPEILPLSPKWSQNGHRSSLVIGRMTSQDRRRARSRVSTQGSIKRTANGTWSLVVDVPGVGGKRKQLRRRGFATKKDAQAALVKLSGDMQRGTFVRPTKDRFGAYLETWLAGLPAAGRRPTTVAGYRSALGAHVIPALGDIELQALRATDLDALYSRLLAKGLSMATVRKLHVVIGKALADATKKGIITINVARVASPPSASSAKAPEMSFWTPTELRSFLASIEQHRMYPVFRLASMSGLRRGELCGLRWSDVDLDGGTITVRQTITTVESRVIVGDVKTSRSRRKVDLDRTTVAVLKTWRKTQLADRMLAGPGWSDTGLLFTTATGEGWHPDLVSRMFYRLLAAQQASSTLPQPQQQQAEQGGTERQAPVRRIRLHDLRHTHASHLLAAGINVKVVSERLGHASVAFTLDTYAHVMPGQQAEAAAAVALLID